MLNIAPALYSRTLLFVPSKWNSSHLLTPGSQSFPPHPLPLGNPVYHYVWVCFCRHTSLSEFRCHISRGACLSLFLTHSLPIPLLRPGAISPLRGCGPTSTARLLPLYHASADGHLSAFHALAVVNSNAMNTGVCGAPYMDATRVYHTKWSEAERKTNTIWNLYMESKVWYKWPILKQKQMHRHRDQTLWFIKGVGGRENKPGVWGLTDAERLYLGWISKVLLYLQGTIFNI